MTTKKPNFIIQFDKSNPTEEERWRLISQFAYCLMKLSAKQKSRKFKTKKEQKEYEQNFTDFGLKALQHLNNSQNEK